MLCAETGPEGDREAGEMSPAEARAGLHLTKTRLGAAPKGLEGRLVKKRFHGLERGQGQGKWQWTERTGL